MTTRVAFEPRPGGLVLVRLWWTADDGQGRLTPFDVPPEVMRALVRAWLEWDDAALPRTSPDA